MKYRRAATSAIAIAIALVCSVLVPLSQVRTVAVVTTCCCPDPAHCHCPDEKPDHSGKPQMRACHRSTDLTFGPEAPELVPPAGVALAPVAQRATHVVAVLSLPHDAPPVARPEAPS